MAGPDPRPEAVEAAFAWQRGHVGRYTQEALEGGLWILTVPFGVLVVVAGLCVTTTDGLRV
jgi:hypothetical protein